MAILGYNTSMELSLIWLIPLYLILILVWLAVAGVNIWHLFRFGTFDRRNNVAAAIFTVFALAILGVTTAYLMTVDWSRAIELEAPTVDLPEFSL